MFIPMNTHPTGEELPSAPIDVDSMSAEERAKLGPSIARWRKFRGLTAMQLSEAASIDRKTLRTIETGERAGQSGKLHAILEALGIPQVDDYDRFSEQTRSFIFATAPIFEQLPDDAKAEAQNDVTVLLGGKLARSARMPRIGVGARGHDLKIAASDEDDWQKRQEEEMEEP